MSSGLPKLSDGQEQLLVAMLERVDPWTKLHETLINGLEKKFDEGELSGHEILNFAKHLASIASIAELGAAALGIKKVARKVENHQHLNIFNFTPEQWQKMPKAKREVIEELRLTMANGNGGDS